jgi:hypothetical protein
LFTNIESKFTNPTIGRIFVIIVVSFYKGKLLFNKNTIKITKIKLKMTFQEQILQRNSFGLPNPKKPYDTEINHAPKRKKSFPDDEKKN